jgi:hypothetical protein
MSNSITAESAHNVKRSNGSVPEDDIPLNPRSVNQSKASIISIPEDKIDSFSKEMSSVKETSIQESIQSVKQSSACIQSIPEDNLASFSKGASASSALQEIQESVLDQESATKDSLADTFDSVPESSGINPAVSDHDDLSTSIEDECESEIQQPVQKKLEKMSPAPSETSYLYASSFEQASNNTQSSKESKPSGQKVTNSKILNMASGTVNNDKMGHNNTAQRADEDSESEEG